MVTTQATFKSFLPSSLPIRIEEIVQAGARFRARFWVISRTQLGQMERRDRMVLLLLDGRRTLQDVCRLTHRGELEVIRILIRLLSKEYVEFLGTQ